MRSFFCFIFFCCVAPYYLVAAATIQGTVRDSVTGQPISGALVEAVRGGQVRYSDTTAMDGTYSLTGIQPSNYTLVVSAPGYQTQSVGVKPKNNKITTVNFQLVPHGGQINGTVTDATTLLPISGATIRIFQGINLILTTTTNGTGFYSASHLAPGNYIVMASSTGYRTQIQGASVRVKTTTTVDFALQSNPGVISGTVTDALTANPIAGALVEVFNGTILVGFADTDGSGNYTILGLPPGSYTVIASATRYQSKTEGASVISGMTTTLDFALTKIKGTIAGTVSDALTGNPIPSATINVFQGVTFIASVLTDPNGQYSIPGFAPGSYIVTASASGFSSSAVGARVFANHTTAVNFALTPNPGIISGTVADAATNQPISGAVIQVRDSFVLMATAVTDANGKYNFPSLAPGSYTVTATASNFRRKTKVAEVNSNQITVVNFSLNLNSGAIAGTITDAITTLPIPNATAAVFQGTALIDFVLTDVNGDYIISDLAPGNYTVLAFKKGYQAAFSEETVVAGGTTDADFILNLRPGTIAGIVTDGCTGGPIPGAFILVADGPTIVGFDLTDANGNYSINTLAPGNYTVTANKRSFLIGSSSATVIENTTTTVNFSLMPSLLPPISISGCAVREEFLTQTDLIYVISWTASPSLCVEGYQVFRNGKLIAFVPSARTLQYRDHNREKKTDVYTVKAVNTLGQISDEVSVTINDRTQCSQ